MAKALRVDKYAIGGDGRVAIEMTLGNTPLPGGPMRIGYVFPSVQDIKDMLDDVDNREIFETLFRIGMAKFRQANPAMTNSALINGKTITFDLTQPANLVVIS